VSKLLIDKDPFTGVTTYLDYNDSNGSFRIVTDQDVTPHLELAKAIRNDESISRDGIKNSFWQYATLPNVVIEIMKREHGVDVFNKDHAKKMFQVIDEHFPLLKLTNKKHK
jgi:hypothetical protein